jgi:hypothetical protein
MNKQISDSQIESNKQIVVEMLNTHARVFEQVGCEKVAEKLRAIAVKSKFNKQDMKVIRREIEFQLEMEGMLQ